MSEVDTLTVVDELERTPIFQNLYKFVVDSNFIDSDKPFQADSRFEEDLGLDSLDQVEMIMFLEEELDVYLKDEETEHVRTVRDLITLVSTKTDLVKLPIADH